MSVLNNIIKATKNTGNKGLVKSAESSTLSSLTPKATTGIVNGAGGDLMSKAAELGLSRGETNKWILDTSILDTDEGVGKIKDFMAPILGGEKTPSYQRFLEQIGEGEYQMGHRPNLYVGDSETKFPLSNMEADPDYLPKIYGDNEESTVSNLLRLGNSGTDAQQSARIIAKYQNQPDKKVKIYRQAPKDMNYGDWVGLTEDYANAHIGNSPNNRLWQREVPADEVMFAGDDINEWGYYPKQVQMDDNIANELNMAIERAGVGTDVADRIDGFIKPADTSNTVEVREFKPVGKIGDDIKSISDTVKRYKTDNREAMVDSMLGYYDDSNFDYAKIRSAGEKALAKELGDSGLKDLKSLVKPVVNDASSAEEHEINKVVVKNFLKNKDSDSVVELSKKLFKPGQKIYRRGTLNGVSWTTDPSVLDKYEGEIMEYVLRDNDRYIAPQIVSLLQDTLDDESQVIFSLR